MNNRGFSLLEVLVAVFILALMSLIIWQITNNAYRGANNAKDYDKIYQYGHVALKRITGDFASAYLIGPSFQGQLSDGTVAVETSFTGENQGDADMVNFVSFSHRRMIRNERKCDQVEVGYYVSECPDSEEKLNCLMRRESAVIDTDSKTGGEEFPIAKNIKKFNLSYYDENKKEWRDDWNSKDPVYFGKLPQAVRVTISFPHPKEEDGEIVFTTAVEVPLSTGMISY